MLGSALPGWMLPTPNNEEDDDKGALGIVEFETGDVTAEDPLVGSKLPSWVLNPEALDPVANPDENFRDRTD